MTDKITSDAQALIQQARKEFRDSDAAGDVLDWLEERLASPPAGWVPDEAMARIGELIRTQDNRITAEPIFIVQQKRRICGVEDDYADGHMWYDPLRCESYDDDEKAERDAERESEDLPPVQWQRGGYVDTWEFVTACFTEQGCKDYIAADGHNLREPRIYAAGSYRNNEWRAVRKYLAASQAAADGAMGGGRG